MIGWFDAGSKDGGLVSCAGAQSGAGNGDGSEMATGGSTGRGVAGGGSGGGAIAGTSNLTAQVGHEPFLPAAASGTRIAAPHEGQLNSMAIEFSVSEVDE